MEKRKKQKTYKQLRQEKTAKRMAFNAIFTTFFVVVLILFLIITVVTSTMVTSSENVGSFFGYSMKIVSTGSMLPTIVPGDVVIIYHDNSCNYSVGDIITYVSSDEEIGTYTHRIVSNKILSDGALAYVTQGDANNVPDEEFPTAESIIGKVVTIIPQIGRVIAALQQIPTWLNYTVLILVTIVFISIQIVDVVKESKRELTEEEKKEQEFNEEYNAIIKLFKRVKKALKLKFTQA